MELTAEAILEFAAQRAQKTWDDNATAYLLAKLSPELREQGVDYKEVIGSQTLKEFVSGAPDKLRVVLHPTQRSKVGLVPAGIDFEFPVTVEEPAKDTAPTAQPRPPSRHGARTTVMTFLELVGRLEPADAERVQIPTDILAKLVRMR